MAIDFIVDCETLGQDGNSVILSIAMLPVTDETFEYTDWDDFISIGLEHKLKLNEQIKRGRIQDTGTMRWWAEQGDAAKHVLSKEGRWNVPEALSDFVGFLDKYGMDPKKSKFWCRGLIDSIWIDSLCATFNIKPITPWRQYRDIRTFCDIALGICDPKIQLPINSKYVKHSALCDCIYEFFQLKECLGC